MNFIIRILGILVMVLAFSCNGSKDPLQENEIEGIEDPVAATLVFPENNTECQEGIIVNDTQSRVVFEWNASEHTDSYEVQLENLNLNTSSVFESDVDELAIILERGTAYRWFVVSKSNTNEKATESEVWQFYNAGAGTVSHAPFPADAVSPPNNSEVAATSGSITLQWEAEDIDDDIISYEIYLGSDNPPTASIGTTMDKEITVDVVTNSTYYWYICTEDSADNSSKSDVFSFSTE